MIETLTDWGATTANTILGWTASVPTKVWVVAGTAGALFATRGTLFETHALLSYHVQQRITEARADREWARLGSLSEAEFDALITARKAWADEKFEKADICKNAADEAAFGLRFPGRVAALRKRARKHVQAMHAINEETERLLELKARVEGERAKQANATSAIRIRKLMEKLLASDPVAHSALAELNRIATQIDWDPFLHELAETPHIRERTLNILRRMAGTDSLGEARNAHSQYQQMRKAQRASA